ncbi:hypothetical protein BJ944DRAFT_292166 [Cunninghamella echinulata]|nr:hypothetical protein BJ944DRAFT_292166 [Cunninghamella echinulata]
MDKQEDQIKVKVYYSLRGSTSTRLSTFQISTKYDQNTNIISIPLKKCLWSICSSSPDMICHDHDLSIYTANFHESLNHFDQQDKYIWEGHGLMSWVMDDQHANDTQIEGKFNYSSNQPPYIDVYIELQPTLKWCKTEFYNALQSQDFEGFKQLSLSSSSSSSTQNCKCSIHSTANPQQQQQQSINDDNEFNRFLKRRKLTPPPTPLSASSTSPTLLPSIHPNNNSYNNNNNPTSSPPRLPPPASMISQIQSQQQSQSQQVAAIRTYYEVDKDQHGKYILPVEIDSWTVVDLGTVVYDRPAYHNQRYVYPVGYTVRK